MGLLVDIKWSQIKGILMTDHVHSNALSIYLNKDTNICYIGASLDLENARFGRFDDSRFIPSTIRIDDLYYIGDVPSNVDTKALFNLPQLFLR